jgi:signal transduction histidine kinase/ligand-binding sensor domain-containing protein
MNLGSQSKHPARLEQILLCALFASLAASPARAVDPNNHISQYAHTAWRVQDGIFGGTPRVLAQTADGYLWIGTMSGLVRFDGVRFVPWDPPSGEKLPSQRINSILGATDGSLWIGTAVGLSRWQNNHLTNYQAQRGVVTAILEDADSTIWSNLSLSATKTPLCKINSTGMKCFGAADGIPPGAYWPLAKDNQGNFWIGRQQGLGLIRWKPDSHDAYGLKGAKNTDASVSSIAVQADGSLWTGIDVRGPGLGLQAFVKGIWKPFITPELDGSKVAVITLLLDRENALWVGTAKNGIYRIYHDKVEHFGSTDGLSSDFVYRIFEDREGNLWVATSKGIDSFRDLRVVSFSTLEGLSAEEVDSVFASRDGGVWVGGPSSMDLIREGHISFILAERGISGGATSFFEDHANRLWVGIDNTLSVYEGGKFRQITRRNGSPIGMVYSITEDTENNIWIESPGPLTRIRDFKVDEEFPSPQMPAAFRVVADPRKGIWLGLTNGDLARYQDGRTDTFHFQHTPNSRVEQLTVNPDGSVLGATAYGLIGWRSGKQVTLTTQNGLPCDVAYASILDDQGNLWIYMQCGLIEIKHQELQNWWEHPDAKLQPRLFDALDGAQPGRAPFGGVTRSPDGKLWFASGVVLQMIDPDHLGLNSVPPPVHVEGITADHRNYPLQDGLRLPPLTRDVEVDYTGLSFVAPQKVRFRYRLEGRDTGWQDPGIRRQAFYTDLRPGRYTFRVIACNNDGVWNQEGAKLDFSVASAWYQTDWFRIACAAFFLLLLWVLFRFRIHQLARQFNTTMETRVAERTRIARDLHDTLLQSLHGLMFRFQAARNMLPQRPEEAMGALDGAITRTEQAIAESRDAIKDLRSESSAQTDLGELLTEIGTELTASRDANGDSPRFSVTVEGERQTISPMVQEEVCQIAREALRNAFRHAKARQIEVEVRYDRRVLRLRFRDDGAGIDPKILKDGGRPGHWGLPGIRERAQRIRARLDFWSEVGAGTEIQLTLPAVTAYEASRQGARFGLFSKVRKP